MLFQSTVLAAAVSLATVAQAQYTIDPESVPQGERGELAYTPEL